MWAILVEALGVAYGWRLFDARFRRSLMTLIVHSHFHRRRTGVTSHVESIVPALNTHAETMVLSRGFSFKSSIHTLSMPDLVKILDKGEPCIWHAHRNQEMLAALFMRRRYPHVRVVFTRHTAGRPSWPTRVLMSRADVCVVLNTESLGYVQGVGKLVYHGVDTQGFNFKRDRKALESLSLSPRALVVGVVGRVRPEKGHAVLVDAIAQLCPSFPELKVLFIGACDAKYRPWLRRLQDRCPGVIEWVGEQSNMSAWYYALDILVLPSFREGFSCTVLEAMACGCPVVVSQIADFEHLLTHGEDGFLFPAGDHAALQEILNMLICAPEHRRSVGESASQKIHREFTIQVEAKALAQIYSDLLSGI
jgi:mannosyltransferase